MRKTDCLMICTLEQASEQDIRGSSGHIKWTSLQWISGAVMEFPREVCLAQSTTY